MSGIRDLRKVQGTSADLARVQDKVQEFVKPFIQCPIIDGQHLTSITLSTGSNTIEHKLGRALRGWWITGQSANAAIWDDQANNLFKSKTLVLHSDADVTVSLWCFNMSTTTFMNLELPTVTVTLGPEWATELNTALETVDAHDHSSGKGTKVTPAGININVDLDFNEYRATSLKSSQYADQLSTLTGAGNVRSLYAVSGDLYFTSGAGTAVQLTSGGSIVSTPGAVTNLQSDAVSSDLVISASDNFVLLRVDTSAARTISLPLASSVAVGRIYIIQDASGSSESFPITLQVQGSDTIEGGTSITINSNYGTIWVTGDGLSKWACS